MQRLITYIFGVILLLGSITNLHAIAYGNPNKEDTIIVDRHELWTESNSVNTNYNFKCDNFEVRLSVYRDKKSVIVTHVSVNNVVIDQSIQRSISKELVEMDGFDYPYVACTSKAVSLTFDKYVNVKEEKIASYSIRLN